jgi:lactoylglutathione lyase
MTTFSYSLIFVSDMAKSVAFYRDALGLPLRMESREWSEFETDGCTLALHLSKHGQLAPVGKDKIPAGHSHPGFTVDDLDAFHQRMVSLGVPCLQLPRLEDFGAKMAVYVDPDGVPISVTGAMPS